jgi:protein-S-isoprenylcysteine O-methyltransferase Ste14
MVVLSLLSLIFTIALAYATIELPEKLGAYLSGFFPDIHPVVEPDKISEFMAAARPVGYACLGVIAILIVAGFVTRRKSLTLLGSAALFLPAFGYFFSSMFFLAGLGILRVPLIPFWDAQPNLMHLGDIAYLPYMAVVYPFWRVGIDVRMLSAWIAIGVGLFLFFLSVTTWFYGRVQQKNVFDFGIYRYCRHPQYLGFIVWSYGVMLIAGLEPVVRAGENPGAGLSWLLSSLAVVFIAVAEESSMMKNNPRAYLDYRAKAPFMLPIPGVVKKIAMAPMKFVFKKDRPETGWELLGAFLVYAGICILLSLPFVLLRWPADPGWSNWPGYLP